jgi:hypothetical protein
VFRKDIRKFRDDIDRELWNLKRKAPKPFEEFKERISNATRIYIRGKNETLLQSCVHAPDA